MTNNKNQMTNKFQNTKIKIFKSFALTVFLQERLGFWKLEFVIYLEFII